jgi:hypothetical protein
MEFIKLGVIAFMVWLIYDLGSHRGEALAIQHFLCLCTLAFFLWRLFRIMEDQIIDLMDRNR